MMDRKRGMRLWAMAGIFWVLGLSSCLREDCCRELPPAATGGLWVVNEGNFTFGNGSLSYLQPRDSLVLNSVFFEANGVPLGDVPQSIFQKGDSLWVVVNNSGKLVCLNRRDYRYCGEIEGLISPRFGLIISNREALISDLYSKDLTLVDLEAQQILGYLRVGHSTERMLAAGNYVFVTGWTLGNYVYKIDRSSRVCVDSIAVGHQPHSLVQDKEGKIWVLCDGAFRGSPGGHFPARLVAFDPVHGDIVREFVFETLDQSPQHLAINPRGDTLYYINSAYASGKGQDKGIYTMSIHAAGLPQQPLIPEKGRLFNAMALSAAGNEIWVSDAVDYQQRGWVRSYTRQGQALDSFRVDLIPGQLLFDQ
jgi:hypothetical protein